MNDFWEIEETIDRQFALLLLGKANSTQWREHDPETLLVTKAVAAIESHDALLVSSDGLTSFVGPSGKTIFKLTLAKKKEGTWNQIETRDGLKHFDLYEVADYNKYLSPEPLVVAEAR
jgi:hypothetical protein